MSKRLFGNSASRNQNQNTQKGTYSDEQVSALYALGLLTSSDTGPRRREIDKTREADAAESYPKKSKSPSAYSLMIYNLWYPVIIEVLGGQL
jgi:hypothetical protein